MLFSLNVDLKGNPNFPKSPESQGIDLEDKIFYLGYHPDDEKWLKDRGVVGNLLNDYKNKFRMFWETLSESGVPKHQLLGKVRHQTNVWLQNILQRKRK